jgi:hypothetical protein
MADKQDTKKDEITVVGPGADEDESATEQTPVNEGAGTDYNYADPDGDETEGREAGEERAGHAQNEPGDDDSGLSREQKRRRRKREKYERDQRELNFLRSRNEQLEREHSLRLASVENRQTQSDVLAIDGRITQAQSDVREADSLFAQAVKSGDEVAIAQALQVRDELRDGLRQLQGAKQQTVRAARERETAGTQPTTADPAVVQRAQEWAREHDWFDPQSGDEDSAIALAVERRLFSEGRLHPSSREYWQEVDRRLARRLPEHYSAQGGDDEDEDDDDNTSERRPAQRRVNGNGKNGNLPRRPSGPTIKVGGRERTLKKGEVYIDEDRKQAMIEKGVWDDPVLRERQLRYYQTYDREAGRRPR